MTKHTGLVLIFLILLTLPCVSPPIYCYEGTFEIKRPDDYLECALCPEGTYMPEYDHRHTACYNCTKTQSYLEVLVSPCNRTHDAVIHCVDGYYRYLPRNTDEKETCKKCTECQNTGRPYQTYSDTICCMQENSEVVTHEDGYVTCKERPYLCRKGQYMDTSVNECLPCPTNTFMSLDYHVMKECLKCPHYNLPLHAEIIQPCNSTHAPVVACKKGFYMNHAMGYKDSSIGCSPCRDCNKASLYEGRACDGLHDTVCCPQPNMTVRDTLGDHLCEPLQLEGEKLSGGPGSDLKFKMSGKFNWTPFEYNGTNHIAEAYENFIAFLGEQLPTLTRLETSLTRNENTETMWPCTLHPAVAFSINVLIFCAFLLSMCVNCFCSFLLRLGVNKSFLPLTS